MPKFDPQADHEHRCRQVRSYRPAAFLNCVMSQATIAGSYHAPFYQKNNMKIILFALTLFVSSSAFAEKTTGSDLLFGCPLAIGTETETETETVPDDDQFFAFLDCATRLEVLVGVMREVAKVAPDSFFAACLPESVSVGQGIRLTIKWVVAHPEKMHLDATVVAAQALRDAFPCTTRK